MRVNSGTPNGCGYDWQLPVLSLQTEKDANSLFHAASLGFWGVHDRTSLLFQAVFHTLSDPKAQFLIYDRWSDEMARSMPAGSKPVSGSSLIMHTSLCLEYTYTLHLRLTGTIGFIHCIFWNVHNQTFRPHWASLLLPCSCPLCGSMSAPALAGSRG